jgi:hypothetical protein
MRPTRPYPRFAGIGAIHRTLAVLRLSGGELEFAFNSEISPGKWTQGAWGKAADAFGSVD